MRALQAQLIRSQERKALLFAKYAQCIWVPRPCLSVVWRDRAGVLIFSSNAPVLFDEVLALRLAQLEVPPCARDVSHLEVIDGHLQLIGEPHIAIFGDVP